MEEKAYPIKIGLEIHGYLATNEKLFCKCLTRSDDDSPNSRVCPICTGQPGSKPMLPNEMAMKNLIKIAIVLGCKINTKVDMIWQRKHYNWSDLPKGYQNTISGGHAVFPAAKGKFRKIGITECHLEEDPAQWNPDTGRVNYNRSGLPLTEIVTDPNFRSAEEVMAWLKNLIHSLSYIKTIDREGGIKVDVNVSTYGDRVEIKNMHSIENIGNAIEYEVARQLENHDKGIIQKRETLRYDEKLGKTIKMRDKESLDDYRFIPDPDLPLIRLDEKMVLAIGKEIPEMPEKKLKKLIDRFKVDKKNAEILAKNLELVEFFEALVESKVDMQKNLSWITIELLRVLNYNKKTLEDADVDIKPEHLAELIKFVEDGKITVLKGKQVMNDFVPKSFSLAEHDGEISSIDDAAIENLCKQVISENAHVVEQYKGGKEASLNFLIGQVMRLSERRADFKVAGEMLKKLIV
jgi:aspartyl-tRNA(Asn)/glutamyl-tRNA(Gln) amidotransferase subunit B